MEILACYITSQSNCMDATNIQSCFEIKSFFLCSKQLAKLVLSSQPHSQLVHYKEKVHDVVSNFIKRILRSNIDLFLHTAITFSYNLKGSHFLIKYSNKTITSSLLIYIATLKPYCNSQTNCEYLSKSQQNFPLYRALAQLKFQGYSYCIPVVDIAS